MVCVVGIEMPIEADLDSTAFLDRMTKGLQDLSERIDREAPKRGRGQLPQMTMASDSNFHDAARCLSCVEEELHELWPTD